MEVEMSNHSMVIFDRKLTLPEVRAMKKKSACKSFQRFGKIKPDLLLIANKLLNKTLTKEATVYELQNHDSLLFLFFANPPAIIMYRANDISPSMVRDFEKFANHYDFFLKYKVKDLFFEIERHNKTLESLSVVPHDNSLKNLVPIIEASVEEDFLAVKAACVDYFASLTPS
jgi:hypothetical protein